MARFCWKPSCYMSTGGGEEEDIDNESEDNDSNDGKVKGLMWNKRIGEHLHGDFSMAVMQANGVLEDQCQIESGPLSCVNNSGPLGTFVGVYDGHGGPQAAYFVNNNLFYNIARFTSEEGELTEDAVRKAFEATDAEFLSLAKRQWDQKPYIAYTGTCCLVGIVSNGHIITANAGDSRAVLGRVTSSFRTFKAFQLTTDHNAKMLSERDAMQSLYPDDPDIVVQKHKAWRVKGIIQVTRSIGDAYLKSPEFNKDPLPHKYRVPGPFTIPILRAEPSIATLKLQKEDHFVIFASDGLWEQLTNHEAVNIVGTSPRIGVAKKLVNAALQEAARKREMRFLDLERIEAGVRRHFHDDISVIVLYIDRHYVDKSSTFIGEPLSVKGGVGLSSGSLN